MRGRLRHSPLREGSAVGIKEGRPGRKVVKKEKDFF